MSVSTTHRRPRHASSMRTWRASCAERLGRNPKLQGWKSASKIGSITVFTAACTMRSRTAGTVALYCLFLSLAMRLGIRTGLRWTDVATRVRTLCLDVGVEGDEPPSAESAPSTDVVAFDPVVDDIGADAEDEAT